MEWTHGGDLYGYELEYGRAPLDFSASVSPLGVPEGVRLAAERALADSCAYPDPQCRGLRRALAARLGVPDTQILCGGGASDLIYRLAAALRPREALIPVPTFSEYEKALALQGSHVRRFPLREAEDFRLPEEFLRWITPETDAVFLCQPGNPTGVLILADLLREIADRCDQNDTLLVLDECFLPFLEDPDRHSLLPELARHRLLILRAFTKFYGMAGLRLGYGLSADAELLERMAAAGPPWPVSNVAQTAGIAALAEDGYARELRTLIAAQRPLLRRGLETLGLRVVPGQANYLLFHADDPSLGQRLKQQGVLIRDCRNFPGLEPGWFRVAVKTSRENEQLLAAIREARD